MRDLHTGQVYDYQALLDGSMWTPGEERSAEGQGHGPSPLQGRAAGESRGGGHLRGSSGQDGGGGGHNGVCGQNGCGQQQGFEADGIGDDDGSLQKHEVGVGGAGGVQTPAERRATAP